MGVTQFSVDLIDDYLKDGKSILEFGCQNIYTSDRYGQIAKQYFLDRGMHHISVDINGGQLSLQKDLREPLNLGTFDIVTDFGTIEHVSGDVYAALKNAFDSCIIDGYIVHENPKTGNWEGHGNWYFDIEFWKRYASYCDLEILRIGENAAMGNVTDGWNIHVVFKKTGSKFISKANFKKLNLKTK